MALAFAAIVVLLIGVLAMLGIYTRHDRTVTIPDLNTMRESEIISVLEDLELRYTVVDSIYDTNLAKGIVVDQIPAAGKKVKKDRMLFLTINAFSAEQVKMPALVDYSLRNARVMLESNQLQLGRIVYQPSEFPDLILGQLWEGKEITAGTALPKGSKIDLLVGQGLGSEIVPVPDLLGLTLSEVKQVIAGSGVTQGSIIYDPSIQSKTDTLTAMIWKQSPTYSDNAQMAKGSSVDIWLTTRLELLTDSMAIDETSTNDEYQD